MDEKKLAELTEEELAQVTGGVEPDLSIKQLEIVGRVDSKRTGGHNSVVE